VTKWIHLFQAWIDSGLGSAENERGLNQFPSHLTFACMMRHHIRTTRNNILAIRPGRAQTGRQRRDAGARAASSRPRVFRAFPWVSMLRPMPFGSASASAPISIGCFAAVRARGRLLRLRLPRAAATRAVALPLSPRLHRVLPLATAQPQRHHAPLASRLYKPSLIPSESSPTGSRCLALFQLTLTHADR